MTIKDLAAILEHYKNNKGEVLIESPDGFVVPKLCGINNHGLWLSYTGSEEESEEGKGERMAEEQKIGDVTVSVFRLALDDRLLEFYDFADEMADLMGELGTKIEVLQEKDFQGVLEVSEQLALSKVRTAAEDLMYLLINAMDKIEAGPTVGHLFEKRRRRG